MPSQSLATLLPPPLATTVPTTSGKSGAARARTQGGAFAGWLSRLLQPAPATTSATQTQTQGQAQAPAWTPARTALADLDAVMSAPANGPAAAVCQNGQAQETTATRATTTQPASGKPGTARRDTDAAGKARDRPQPATDVVQQALLSADSITPPASGTALATATTGQDIARAARADDASDVGTDVSPATSTEPAVTVLPANPVAPVAVSDAGDAAATVPPAVPDLADTPDNPPAPAGHHATATTGEDTVEPPASDGTTTAASPPTLSFADTPALATVPADGTEAADAGRQAAAPPSDAPRTPVTSTRSAAGQTARGSPSPSAAVAEASAVAPPHAAATESVTATGASARSDAAGHAARPRLAEPDVTVAKPTGPSAGTADTRVLDDQPNNAGAPQTRLSSRPAPQPARDAAASTTADADTATTAASATADPSPAQAAQTATALIAPAADHMPRADASATAGATSAANDPAGQLAPTLTRLAGAGGTRQLTVRLAPPELGSVTISVSHAPGGTIAVALTAERPETLQALQRSQAQLDRALDAAGMAAHGREVTLHLAAAATPAPSAAAQPSSTPSTSTTAMASTDNAWLGQAAGGGQGDGHASGQGGGGRRPASRGGGGTGSPPLAATAATASAAPPAWLRSGIDITA
jgi:hypothetical protein